MNINCACVVILLTLASLTTLGEALFFGLYFSQHYLELQILPAMSNYTSGPSAIGLGLGILAFKKGLLLGTAIAGRRTRFINHNINQEYISLIFLEEHTVLDASVTLGITTITTPTTPDPTLTTTTLQTDIPEATEEREMWTVRSFWRCSE